MNVVQGRAEPVVSAVVASYNSGAFLERCVRSILAQSLSDIEVVIVDDVSRDDSLTIARRLAEEDARVRVAPMPVNGGPAGARNHGFGLARGRWIAVVDSDDLLHPARFETLVAAADAAEADMVADDLLVFADGLANEPERFLKDDPAHPFTLDLREYLRRSIFYGADPNPGFLKPLIRRDRLIASGVRYDETLRIAEDDDLIVRLLLAGLAYRIVPRPLYFYRKHGQSISHRLSVATMAAMCEANARLAMQALAGRPDLADAFAGRRRSLERSLAFERFVAAAKARRPGEAAGVLARHPAAIPLLRMPIAGLVAKLRGRPTASRATVAPDAELPLLVQAVDG